MAKPTIFVIDDEQDNLEFISAIIEEAGHTAATFVDGNAALEHMRDTQPALVFLDVQMPKINGFQVLKSIRNQKELTETPVVMLSAIGAVTGEDFDPDLIESKYGVRPDAFIAKPIEPDKVTNQIRAILG